MSGIRQAKKSVFSRFSAAVLSGVIALSFMPRIIIEVFAEEISTITEEQSGDLQYQTISTTVGDDKSEVITLDGMMPGDAEVNVENHESEDNICAYDISITDINGSEFQPEETAPIKVEITNTAIGEAVSQEQKLRLWHIDDDGIREEIKNFKVVNDSVIFEAKGFSVYEIDNGTPPLRTYYFEIPENPADNTGYKDYYFPTSSKDSEGNNKMICQQTVKNSEKPVFPQLPADIISKYTFIGWFVYNSSSGTLSDEPYNFNNIADVTNNEELVLRAVFKSCVFAIFHNQYNGASQKFPIMATRRGDLTSGSQVDVYGNATDLSAEIYIKDIVIAYDDESQAEGEPIQMAFKGWTVVPERYETQEEIKAYTESSDVQVINTDTIRITKTTRLYPVFEPIRWLEFNTNQDGSGENANTYTGATYKPPLYFASEEGFSFKDYDPPWTPPKLAGYAFDGWYTGDGTKVTDSNLNFVSGLSTPTLEVRNNRLFFKDVSGQQKTLQIDLYAHWSPANSKYTVVIWRQKADDSPGLPQNQKSYDFAESFRLDATTGDPASVADEYKSYSGRNDYKGFTYSSCSPDTTVLGNGKTVLDVYYDRNVHTFTFSVNNSTVKTVTALYGSSVVDIFPVQGYESYIWADSTKKTYDYTLATLETMPDSDVNFNGEYRGISETIYYYVETDADDTEDFEKVKTFNGLTYGLYKTVRHGFNYLTYDEEYHPIEGYLRDRQWAEPYFGERGTNNSGGNSNIAPIGGKTSNRTTETDINYLYYNRDIFSAQFIDSFNNESIASENIKFRQKLENFIPNAPDAPEGYEFTGWYTDIGCTTKVFFHEPSQEEIDATKDENGNAHYQVYNRMPAYNIRIYAGWQTQWFKIEIDPNGGTLTESQATWFWEPYNGDPIMEYKTATRNFEPDVNGNYYYVLRNRAYYGLGEEWDPEEDTTYKNQIIDGHCTRGAFYTTDTSLIPSSDQRYREADGAYRYLGWFEVDPETQKETPFNFGTRVTKNTYLRLHWKQLGTYHIKYDAGAGTIDMQDSNETTFEFLDADDYADHADVVVTRVAKPPEDMNFVGWKIRNDPSGIIYYPGQSFTFSSSYASSISEVDDFGNVVTKKIITLDAVYQKIENTKIIYDPNGGVIDNRALLHAGGQDYNRTPLIHTSDTDYPISVETKIGNNQLVVSDLMNNSAIRLADGIGFSNPGYTFTGWSTTRNGEGGSFFKKDSIKCYVDNAEPVVLYAQWEFRVYFDKNNTNSPNNTYGWGGDWTESGYKWSAAKQQYYTVLNLGSKADKPIYSPVSDNSSEMFKYWSLKKQGSSGVMEAAFDFNTPITREMVEQYGGTYSDGSGNTQRQLTLYGCWDTPIRIPVHIVDTTSETWEKHDDWLREGVTHITLRNEEIPFSTSENAEVYADPSKVSGKTYVFACTAGNDSDDYLNISEDKKILAMKYDAEDMKVKVKYSSDNLWYSLDTSDDTPEAIYLVYYSEAEQIPIGYKVASHDGNLNNPSYLNSTAPVTTNISGSVSDMKEIVKRPLAWATGNGYSQKYYSYAIGSANAAGSDDLHVITEYSDTDNSRPTLQIKKAWNGLQYSLDGSSWHNYGYEMKLYVIYYEESPTIVNLTEKTIGLPQDMNEEFEYTVKITLREIDFLTRTYYTRRNYMGNVTYSAITNNSNYEAVTTDSETSRIISTQTVDLKDSQIESFALLYGETSEQLVKDYTNTGESIGSGLYSSAVYYRDTKITKFIQEIDIEQTPKAGYITTNDAENGDHEYKSYCSASGNDENITITYTNRHQLEKHIHLAIAEDGVITHNETLRTSDPSIYSHIFGDEWNFSEIDKETFINDPEGIYGFGEAIRGTENADGTVLKKSSASCITKLSFGDTGGGQYAFYINEDTSKLLGDDDIYFVYFKRPKIQYMLRTPRTGELVQIDPLYKNGSAFKRNETEISQNEILPVSSESELYVSSVSTPGNPAFIIPDLLDHNGRESFLDLSEIDIRKADGSMQSFDRKSIYLEYDDASLKYHFNGSDTPKTFDDEHIVYAVYRIRGYALTLKKSIVGDTMGESTDYTFKISSDALADGEYYIGGYGETETVSASDGDMTLTMHGSGSVIIYGLSQGVYTIAESVNGSCHMTAKINGNDVAVNNNRLAASINADTLVEVINIYPIPVTGAGESARPYVDVMIVIITSVVLRMIIRRREENRI